MFSPIQRKRGKVNTTLDFSVALGFSPTLAFSRTSRSSKAHAPIILYAPQINSSQGFKYLCLGHSRDCRAHERKFHRRLYAYFEQYWWPPEIFRSTVSVFVHLVYVYFVYRDRAWIPGGSCVLQYQNPLTPRTTPTASSPCFVTTP